MWGRSMDHFDEQLLKETDRDSYYYALNLIDEFSELDEETYLQWEEDVFSLDEHYQHFIFHKILIRVLSAE